MLRPRVPAIGIILCGFALAAEWRQFRGENASGVAKPSGVPDDFGPAKNVIWKVALPPGHSSPVVTADRIFVSAWEENKLLTFALDRASGRILWRREIERPRQQELHKMNTPASTSPVSDGTNVYVFFGDFGLVSYGPDGNERWRVPLGPFNNPFGMGASPVLAEGKVLQACDAETGSFFIAVDQKTGKVAWRAERPEFTRGFSTPVLWKPADGGLQAILAGSGQLTAYSVASGQPVWWIRGLTWQLKPTPVLDGDRIYVLGWAGGADTGQQEEIMPFAEALKQQDANKDGKIALAEVSDPRVQKQFKELDLDVDGALGERDWRMYQVKRSSVNAVSAFRLGGKGDMTDKAAVWRYYKSLPNVPSPLLYEGVLYLMKEGGILTTLDPATGEVLKQARLTGALDQYFSSPVGVDGKVLVVSQAGNLSVIKAGREWEVIRVIDMDDECFATPIPLDGRIYMRTKTALYSFGAKPVTASR